MSDPKQKIPSAHKCYKCGNLLINPFRCKDNCTTYCQVHLPSNKKCEKCKSELTFNQILTEKINSCYKVKCMSCNEERMLDSINTHLKEECVNRITYCIGCKYKDKKKSVLSHQEKCDEAQRYFKQIQPLQKLVEMLLQKNEFLENENNMMNERICYLEKKFEDIHNIKKKESTSKITKN